MKKAIGAAALALLALCAMPACNAPYGSDSHEIAQDGTTQTGETGTDDSGIAAEYRKISAADARDMMSEADSFIILDVRSDEEYKEQHIPDAVLIPDTEISARAESELTDKNAMILVYCRSGRRSALAANLLVSMGYTNVYDFGGIIDWPYETE